MPLFLEDRASILSNRFDAPRFPLLYFLRIKIFFVSSSWRWNRTSPFLLLRKKELLSRVKFLASGVIVIGILIWNSLYRVGFIVENREEKRSFILLTCRNWIFLEIFLLAYLTSSNSRIARKRTNVSKVFTNFTSEIPNCTTFLRKRQDTFRRSLRGKKKNTQYSHFHRAFKKNNLWIFDDKSTTNPLINPMAH